MSDRLTREDVRELARLARLALADGGPDDGPGGEPADEPEDEIERARVELAAVLDHMDALRAVDTDGVEPMTHAVPMDLRLRADTVEPSLPAEVAVAQAPDRDADGSFRVPSVIKQT